MGPNPKPHEFIPYPSFHFYEDLFWHADIVFGLVFQLFNAARRVEAETASETSCLIKKLDDG
jgi:squalene cyclase